MMQTGVVTLTDFLLDRLAELELSAQVALATAPSDPIKGITPAGAVWFTPEQVLADVAAKRAIVERVSDVGWTGTYAVRDVVLGLMALPYAAHPDYREEWRP